MSILTVNNISAVILPTKSGALSIDNDLISINLAVLMELAPLILLSNYSSML